MAKEILPPSSSPAGMLLMALMRSPAHAHITRGLTDMGVLSLRTSPTRSFAENTNTKHQIMLFHFMKQSLVQNQLDSLSIKFRFRENGHYWPSMRLYEWDKYWDNALKFVCECKWALTLGMKCLPIPPARKDSWNTEASTTTPIPSLGGKINPKSKRTKPKPNPAKGPATATFRRSSRFGTIFKILVIAPKEPICHQKSSL